MSLWYFDQTHTSLRPQDNEFTCGKSQNKYQKRKEKPPQRLSQAAHFYPPVLIFINSINITEHSFGLLLPKGGDKGSFELMAASQILHRVTQF